MLEIVNGFITVIAVVSLQTTLVLLFTIKRLFRDNYIIPKENDKK